MSFTEGITRERIWRVIEGVAVLVVLALLGLGVTVVRSTEMNEIHIDAHHWKIQDHEGRLDTIEDSAMVVQLAQATDRLKQLEAGAEVVQENAAAIEGIRATQDAQTGQLQRIESAQVEQTRLLFQILRNGPSNPGDEAATSDASEGP